MIDRIPRPRRLPPARVGILPRLHEPLLARPRHPRPIPLVLLLRGPHRPQRGHARESQHPPDEKIARQRRREGAGSHPHSSPPGRGGRPPPVAKVTYARLANLEVVPPSLFLIPEDGVGSGYAFESFDAVGRSFGASDVGMSLHAYLR